MAEQPKHDPSVSPLTGNAVLTVNTLVGIVLFVIAMLRTKGYEIPEAQENAVVQFLQGGGGDLIIGVCLAVATAISRSRVYSELSVKQLTNQERPSV